ncbi:thiopeptide-type bacteriocin biosynthesis protein [Streptomyces sp. ET3-23]|uniref:thiopeptide-type bacteriocin biosynthesis protein n=1 Tax=Streptomyces sp. ET3-23 TaxID=2885643 RepID=UPI001D10D052|nr:thiopeptide-type bacteriocin biosynthesis protein [Streptomyces sp. ET3-23]MCC2276171.1 thiopeptide-type bacteriocin biosynthesis protein [Streptomyces sp. ET3-23]
MEQEDDHWLQLNLQFTNWASAEQTAANHVVPLLDRAQADDIATRWWFIRKHPCWRLRLRPHSHDAENSIAAAFDDLTASGHLHRWWRGVYEPETAAFGDAEGMRVAHELFHADSRAVLNLHRLGETPIGRRELSLLLCGTLMRAAAVEWYEQGDVWHRVARMRPLPDDVPADRLEELADGLRHLMLADTAPDGPLVGKNGPLAFAADWAGAFREAGAALGKAARAGTLNRGLRHVLAYHVIFHWNRLGLPARKQSILAWAARGAILGPAVRTTDVPKQNRTSLPVPAAASRLVARFPLVPRPRLACPGLATRIIQARDYAYQSEQQTHPEHRLERACSAWNLAALIAADCGMPGLAADLCWRQFTIFQKAWPVAGRTAIASLQPLVNLARLTGRAGDPEGAYQALRAMDHAIHDDGASVPIHGRTVNLDRFTERADDRQDVAPWMRTVLLEDGTRLLAATGQWARAAAHAALYDEAGDRLRDARQVRAIERLHDGDTDSALTLLGDAVITEPWERAVAACLRTCSAVHFHRRAADGVAETLGTVWEALRSLPGREAAFFRVRLGLTAVDLTTETSSGREDELCTELIRNAAESGDAHAARELLRHETVRARMTQAETQRLDMLIRDAGLSRGAIPTPLLSELMGTVETAETCLTQALGIQA